MASLGRDERLEWSRLSRRHGLKRCSLCHLCSLCLLSTTKTGEALATCSNLHGALSGSSNNRDNLSHVGTINQNTPFFLSVATLRYLAQGQKI